MSFWNLSDNSTVNPQDAGTFEIGGGEPIPANTQLKACIDEAAWDEYEGEELIKLTWSVLEGEHDNRKVYQKIRVRDLDSKKRDKAIKMLMAIDANAGGRLMKSGAEPDDNALQVCLLNKPMVIKVAIWKSDSGTGNWVQKVAPIHSFEESDSLDQEMPF